ncbi:MAG: FtsX-like permease family protein [Candidatus Heimdallarchaeota archaeon]
MLVLSLALDSLKRSKIRATLGILGILISTSLLVAVNIGIDSMGASITTALTSEIGDYEITITNGTGGPYVELDEEILKEIQSIPGIVAASGRLLWIGIIGDIEDIEELVFFLGINASADAGIGTIDVVSGDFDLQGSNIFLLEQAAKTLNVSAGDKLDMWSFDFNQEFQNASEIDIFDLNTTVAGIGSQKGKIFRAISDTLPLALVDLNWLQSQVGMIGKTNFIAVKTDASSSDFDDLSDYIRDIGIEIQQKLGYEYNVEAFVAAIVRDLDEALLLIRAILLFLAAISTLVCCILVFSLFELNSAQREEEFGILRSFGFSKMQILAIVLIETLIVASVGGLLGLFVGISYSKEILIMLFGSDSIFVEYASTSVSFGSVLANALIGVASGLIGGILPAIRATNASVVEAMQGKEGSSSSVGQRNELRGYSPNILLLGTAVFAAAFAGMFGGNMSYYLGREFGISGNVTLVVYFMSMLFLVLFGAVFLALAFQNFLVRGISLVSKLIAGQFRELAAVYLQRFSRRSRYAILMISISVASIILIGMWQGTEVKATAARSQHNEGSDIVIRSEETGFVESWLDYSLLRNLSRVLGVKGVTPGYTSKIAIMGDLVLVASYPTAIYPIDPETFLEGIVPTRSHVPDANRAIDDLKANDTIIVSHAFSQEAEIDIGDNVRIETLLGPKSLRVVGIAKSLPGFPEVTSIPERVFYSGAVVSNTTYSRTFGIDLGGMVFPEPPRMEKIFVRVIQDLSPQLAAEQIQQFFEEAEITNAEVSVTEDVVREQMEEARRMEQTFENLLQVSAIIAALGLISSMLAIVIERKHDFAVLRALGLTRIQLFRLLCAETITLGLVGIISGIASGLVVGGFYVWQSNLYQDITVFPAFPWGPVQFAAIATLVSGLIAVILSLYQSEPESLIEDLRVPV